MGSICLVLEKTDGENCLGHYVTDRRGKTRHQLPLHVQSMTSNLTDLAPVSRGSTCCLLIASLDSQIIPNSPYGFPFNLSTPTKSLCPVELL